MVSEAGRRTVDNPPSPGRSSPLRSGNVPPPWKSVSVRSLYRLDARPLGTGTYCEVFRAERRDSGEFVALKRIRLVPEAGARIKREIEAQKLLAPHPNIMPIIDNDPEYRWYTMPIARGTLLTLRHEIDQDGLATILHDLANALDVAHQQDLIHRDISPRNILALAGQGSSGGDRWVVADWGMVSRLQGSRFPPITRTGMAMGTPGFDAPELSENPSAATAAADVYSLGRVAAWFLTGKWPNSGYPLLPDGPALRWRLFVKRCTEHRINDRIQNMTDFNDALERVFTVYDEAPAVQTSRLLRDLLAGNVTKLDELISIALAHPDDPVVHLDHIARIPSNIIQSWAVDAPDSAANVACQVAEHLLTSPWGDRDQQYVGTPLGFVFAILQALTDAGKLGQAQDVAAKFFVADAHWRHGPQRQRSIEWLSELEPPTDRVVAPLFGDRKDLIAYYGPLREPHSIVLGTIFRSLSDQ
jgi:serine/threonine protein kinase